MKQLASTALLIAAIAALSPRHSVPTAPATNRVAVPAANDPSSPNDGAARNTTAIAQPGVAVVSLTEWAHGFKTDRVVATRYVEDDGPDRGRWSIGFTFPSDPNECDRGELCDLITSKGGDIRWCGGFKGAPIRATFPCANDQETVNAKIREVLPELSRLIKEIAGKPSKPAVSGYSPARVAVVSSTPVADVKPGAEAAYPKPPAIASLAVLQFCIDGCGPCVAAQPMVDQLKQAGFDIRYLNCSHQPEAAAEANRLGVNAFPTFIAFDGDKEVLRTHDVAEVEKLLKRYTPLTSGQVISCPKCGGAGHVCLTKEEGGECGFCDLCQGRKIVTLGVEATANGDGSYQLHKVSREALADGKVRVNGSNKSAVYDTKMTLGAVCDECRGGGKLCSDGQCIACWKCGGAKRLGILPSTAPFAGTPQTFIACRPDGTFEFNPAGKPNDFCTVCRCDPVCHCATCICKGNAKPVLGVNTFDPKQVSLPSEPPAGYVSKDVLAMLAENNRIRAAAGKPPQTLDERLCRAAQDQADYMARYHRPVIQNGVFTSPSYSHDTNGGSRARLARAGFPWTDYAENLNLSTPGHPDDSWQSWRNSAPHYGSMLRPFPLAGFGQATARDGSIYSAALYGTESSAAVAPREKVAAAAPPVTQSAQPITQFQTCRPGMPCYQPQQQYQRRGWFGRR